MIKCSLEAKKDAFTSIFFSSNQQIRKLRRELDASQEKVATLTSQLTANVSRLPNLHDNMLQASVFEARCLSQQRREYKPSISSLIPLSKATLCLFRIVCVFSFMGCLLAAFVCQRCGIVSLFCPV